MYLLSSLNFMAGNSSEQSGRTSHTSKRKPENVKGRQNKTFLSCLYLSKEQTEPGGAWLVLVWRGRSTEMAKGWNDLSLECLVAYESGASDWSRGQLPLLRRA